MKDFPFTPHYSDIYGTRMHYVDEGEGSPVLMLHGEPSWSYLYRHFIPPVVEAGHRAVAPDHVGFGRSDKWLEPGRYTFSSHYAQLEQLIIGQLDLKNITLVCQDWGGMLGLTLVGHYPDRFKSIVAMNTTLRAPPKTDPSKPVPPRAGGSGWRQNSQTMIMQPDEFGEFFRNSPGNGRKLDDEEVRAYSAPFPTRESRVSALRFPMLFGNSSDPEDPGLELMRTAHAVLSEWANPSLLLWGDKDNVFPIATAGEYLHRLLKTSNPPIAIEGGGHFVQEADPKRISSEIVAFLATHS
ncbi:MAG: alpha/beta fold hydrolase [Alphaproteobacteria bacterium]|nr:alpha/beta fold hydrolase [Alphaproteobacteria bacterium]